MENIFRKLKFKPLMFDIFGEMSSNAVALVGTTVEYGVEHLGRNMAATTVDAVRKSLRRRYRTQMSMGAWRGYANLLLDVTIYVGTCQTSPNMAKIGHDIRGRGDVGGHNGLFMANETVVPMRDAFLIGWGDY